MATYLERSDSLWWQDNSIYGSNRLGLFHADSLIYPKYVSGEFLIAGQGTNTYMEGLKEYELTNHLGNVLATISDRKLALDWDANGTIDNYHAVELTENDYYPFGMMEPGRIFKTTEGYSYGFNGKYKDNDIEGDGNWQDYGMRVYLPRLGRFLSVDPLTKKYPWYSPYSFGGNRPTFCIDLDGGEDKSFLSYLFDLITGSALSSASNEEELAKRAEDRQTLSNVVQKADQFNKTAKRVSTDAAIVAGGVISIVATGGASGVIAVISYTSASVAVTGGTTKMVLDLKGQNDLSDKIPTTAGGAIGATIEYTCGGSKYTTTIKAGLEVLDGVVTLKLNKPGELLETLKNTMNSAKDVDKTADMLINITNITLNAKEAVESVSTNNNVKSNSSGTATSSKTSKGSSTSNNAPSHCKNYCTPP